MRENPKPTSACDLTLSSTFNVIALNFVSRAKLGGFMLKAIVVIWKLCEVPLGSRVVTYGTY